MTYVFDVNNAGGANGGAEAMYLWKELLKSAGWDVPASSDGTTYNSSGDQITLAGSGSGGMNNSQAWFRVRAPSGMSPRREFCCQRGSSGEAYWWIKYSAEDGFTTSGDADDMATAADEANLHGSSTAGDVLFTTAGTYKIHIGADNASPFGFYLFNAVNGSGASDMGFVFDPLATGSYASADQDPALVRVQGGGSVFMSTYLYQAAYAPNGWYKKDLAGETFTQFPAHIYQGGYGQAAPGSLGTNPHDSDDNHVPIAYARGSLLSTEVGWKGFGTVMRWLGTSRSSMDTLSTSGVRDHVVVDDVVLPWPNEVPSI
ncbi:MAG: hypothetical protein HYY06_05130 [Deltaproteobacteria bacterium]|nr:hypothetical protein [Deltaproteobacteria bacterium]